jgi:hypothetical protein
MSNFVLMPSHLVAGTGFAAFGAGAIFLLIRFQPFVNATSFDAAFVRALICRCVLFCAPCGDTACQQLSE